MMSPGLLYLLINNYIPMFGLFIAFKSINFRLGFFDSPWVGLENFKYLFNSSNAWIITRNTLFYNVGFIIINTTAAIALAIFLNEITSKIFMRIYQTVILLPFLISMVIISYLVYALLSSETGFIDKTILPLLGLDPVSWYSEPKYWPFILTVVKMWSYVGFLCIVYLASIVGIDKEYFEAATLDGASKWKQIKHITLPLIKPVIILMVLFAIGKIFYSDFGLFYQIPRNSGTLYPTTNVIDTYVYRGLLQLGDLGMSSAAGFYQSLVGFILVITSNLVVKKISPENALF
ncbi:MAG TPA: sugar ABC transporter permease [Clostridiales bacterium]|nr:sugar ABC transporter permease [Clostridiales bacterium]